MVQVIARDWGCLMPGYEHAGSGWWRARPLQCADAQSILLGDRKELEVYYGADFPYLELRASDLVDATYADLVLIADAQREALYRLHPLDKLVQHFELNTVLEAMK
jgi:hypothetical protein